MKINEAQELLRLAAIIDEFVEPGDRVGDFAADRVYKRHDADIARFDAAVMRVLREQVIQEALTTIGHS